MFCRRKAMKGRLYFATKAQKEGKIMIKTHPCAQIFCCDICGFEKVLFISIIGINRRLCLVVLHRKCVSTGWHCSPEVAATRCPATVNLGISESERCS